MDYDMVDEITEIELCGGLTNFKTDLLACCNWRHVRSANGWQGRHRRGDAPNVETPISLMDGRP